MIKRLTWVKDKFELIYDCFNDKKEHLGYVKYEQVGRHFHWCWHQSEDIRMSPGCLQEVRDKQKELLKERNKQ